jgi:UDP-2,3-diacylglucosamine pyrophosphatase LpxH
MDEKFGDFLKFLAGLSRPENPVTLVLLGDIFDLIQVTGSEGPAKLDAVRKAHTKFFEYLGRFAEEHAVLYLVGNHDAEMLNPVMTDWLKKAVPKLQLDPQNLPLLFYQEGSLYCEHGNQLEGRPGYNIIDNIYRDFVDQPFTASDYPAGSRFVLESVNSLETKYPDVDNILGDRRAATTWYILKKKGKNGFEQLLDLLRKVKGGVRTASVTSDDDALLLYSLLTGRPPDAADVERDAIAKQLDGMLRAYLGTKPGVQPAAAPKAMWEAAHCLVRGTEGALGKRCRRERIALCSQPRCLCRAITAA